MLELQASTITNSVGKSNPSVSPDIFGSSAHVMRSSRFPGTRMIPSERTMLPLTMLCVAGFVTSLFEKPSWHRPASGCLLHRRAYLAFSASLSSPLMGVPVLERAARFCSAAATAEGKYPYSFGRSNPTEAAGAGAARDASAGTVATVFAAFSNLACTTTDRREEPRPATRPRGARGGAERGRERDGGGGHRGGDVRRKRTGARSSERARGWFIGDCASCHDESRLLIESRPRKQRRRRHARRGLPNRERVAHAADEREQNEETKSRRHSVPKRPAHFLRRQPPPVPSPRARSPDRSTPEKARCRPRRKARRSA